MFHNLIANTEVGSTILDWIQIGTLVVEIEGRWSRQSGADQKAR